MCSPCIQFRKDDEARRNARRNSSDSVRTKLLPKPTVAAREHWKKRGPFASIAFRQSGSPLRWAKIVVSVSINRRRVCMWPWPSRRRSWRCHVRSEPLQLRLFLEAVPRPEVRGAGACPRHELSSHIPLIDNDAGGDWRIFIQTTSLPHEPQNAVELYQGASNVSHSRT